MWGLIVQIVCLLLLLVSFAIVAVVMCKMTTSRNHRRVIPRLLLVESALVISVMIVMRIFTGPIRSVPGFIAGSVLVAMLANLPAAIVAKLIGHFMKPKKRSD